MKDFFEIVTREREIERQRERKTHIHTKVETQRAEKMVPI
jgi:hypothetical protein